MTRKMEPFSASEYQKIVENYAQDWITIDETLYELCRAYPNHDDRKSVNAKIWIIARTYATGIERTIRTNGDPGSSITQVADFFYQNNREIDEQLRRLGKIVEPLTRENISEILMVHSRVLKMLAKITVHEKQPRSFVSKYLHFHCPVVPIYDNVAPQSLRRIVIPQKNEAWRKNCPPNIDIEYADYVYRFAELYQFCIAQGISVTVRLLDYYFLCKTSVV